MIKGIIFDLDGVLVFSDQYHYLAWKKMADKVGIYFDEEINNRLRGVSRRESLEIILEKTPKIYSEEEKLDLMEEKNSYYVELLGNMTEEDVTDEVRHTLRELKHRGFKIAVGSSSKNARYILERVGLIDLFDAVSDGTMIKNSKPNPEVFLKAAELLSLEPAQCLVVEDAKAGIDAAKAGGMLAAGIGDINTYEKVDYSIKSLEDLLGIFKEKCFQT